MRCPSCGFLNAAQALECTNCKTLLDPILATLTVEAPSDPFSSNLPAWPSNQFKPITAPQPNGNAKAPPRPPLPSVPGMSLSGTSAPTMTHSRYVPSSADLDFLVESIGSSKYKAPPVHEERVMSFAPISQAKCPICGRKVTANELVLTQTKHQQYICRDCQARAASKEENAVKRDVLLRSLTGFLAGLLALGICILLANQFGVSVAERKLNWSLVPIAGAAIGLAVRLGARNKPTFALQFIAIFLALATLAGSAYICLNTLTGVTLSPGGAVEILKTIPPQGPDYALIGAGLLLAFVIPSGIFGGQTEDYTLKK
jgi:hypothetical protein